MAHALPDHVVAEIRELGRSGLTVAQVAGATGVNRNTVTRYFELAGIPVPRRTLTADDRATILEQADQGRQPAEIAAQLGASRWVVSRFLTTARPPAPTKPRRRLSAWRARAACRGHDTETFVPDDGDRESIRQAKAVCARCPVLDECLAWALDLRDFHGVLGGTTGDDRRRILRDRRSSEAAS